MAKQSRRIRNAGKKVTPIRTDIAGPTPEQMRDCEFTLDDVTDKGPNGQSIAIGKAYRRKPMIETLNGQGLFTEAQFKALKHYRHHADMADKSLTRDSLDKQRHGGSGTGATVEMLNAQRVRDDCERAAGSLADILRAVVIEDMSLSTWAIRKAGAIEDCVMRNGAKVCRLKPRQKALAIAKLEIRMAAVRVEAELSA